MTQIVRLHLDPFMGVRSEGLEAWTAWIGAVVGLIAGARILWTGGDALRAYAKKP